MWLYVAPGSGVAINVGRSIVVSDFIEASRLLALAFPGDYKVGPAEPATRTGAAEGGGITWTLGHRTKRKLIGSTSQSTTQAIDFSNVDSIQILVS